MSSIYAQIVSRMRFIALAAALGGFAACGGGGGGGGGASSSPPPAPAPAPAPPPPDPAPPPPVDGGVGVALEQVVDEVVIDGAEEFLASTEALISGSDAFCSSGSTDLEDLQERWETVQEDWFYLANYVFGPLNDNIVDPVYYFIDSLRLRGTDYTETVRSVIAEDIASDQVLDNAYFASKTFQRVGLLALEVALFETATGERSQDLAVITAEFANTPRKCEVLRGLAGQLGEQARYVVDGWLVQYRNSDQPFRTLFLNGETDDGTEPLAQLIISLQEHLEYLQSRRVVEVAAQISQNNWEAISAAVDGAEAFLEGTSDTTVRIFDIMIDRGESAAVDEVRLSIAGIREAIELEDPAILEVRLGELDGNFKREIADGLGVELGINFSDGD